jgi:hypothetical protein
MTRLNETKENVPEELAPTVDELATTLEAVKAPGTSLRDRQGVIESVGHLTTALTATGDVSTPPKLRKQLIAFVEQVSSVLKVSYDSQVPSETRSSLLLIMKRTTSALDMICDPQTPAELRGQLITISGGLADAAGAGHQTEEIRGFEEQMSRHPGNAPGEPKRARSDRARAEREAEGVQQSQVVTGGPSRSRKRHAETVRSTE